MAPPGDYSPREIDVTVPSPARVHDYVLGGVTHYHVDREVAGRLLGMYPWLRTLAQASRAFEGRAVRHLASEAGIRQFLDLGSGLPTQENVHQIAQAVHPDARVVYVDNDPIVLAHGQSLLAEDESTTYAQEDLRDVDDVLAKAREFLDWSRPLALVCVSVLHYVPGDTRAIMERYIDGLPTGSYVALAYLSSTGSDEKALQQVLNPPQGTPQHAKTAEEIEELFCGLPLLEPGVVPVELWRPDEDLEPSPVRVMGGVARKP
jgi:SAM-dependent methyltransferase